MLLEHVSAGLSPAEAGTLGADLRALAARRGARHVAATADEAFARAVAGRLRILDPTTGRLQAQGRQAWFGRRLG